MNIQDATQDHHVKVMSFTYLAMAISNMHKNESWLLNFVLKKLVAMALSLEGLEHRFRSIIYEQIEKK